MDMVDWSSQSGFVGVAMMLICHVIHCRPTNECTWRSSISPTQSYEQKMLANPSCSPGAINWYYPSGLLTVEFTHDVAGQQFQVCLRINKAILSEDNSDLLRINTQLVDKTRVSNTRDQSDTRDHVPEGIIHLLTADSDTCISSFSGAVMVVLVAPQQKLYLYNINYTVKPT